MTTVRETIYAIRRTDGEPIYDDFSFLIADGPDDWSAAEDIAEADDVAGEFEMVAMDVQVVATKTLPTCNEGCGEPAVYWGLCRAHAEKDDPDHFAEPRRA